MKLKKIASLALAGVMAVSMLAGCKGNDSSNAGDQGTVVVPATSDVVTALNDGQTPGNTVKITFKTDSVLDGALADVVELKGKDFASNDIGAELVKFISAVQNWTGNVFYDDASKFAFKTTATGGGNFAAEDSLSDVLPVTAVKGYAVTSWTKEAAIASFVKEMDKAIAGLTDDDIVIGTDNKEYVHTQAGGYALSTDKTANKYHTYDYTGVVSMVSEANADGTTTYYFAVAVTQNVTEKTLEK